MPQGILSISQDEALPIGLITQQRNGKTMPWDRKFIQFIVPTKSTSIKYISTSQKYLRQVSILSSGSTTLQF